LDERFGNQQFLEFNDDVVNSFKDFLLSLDSDLGSSFIDFSCSN